ncbi:MAG: Rieske (2Fe-2S) protein [bacterium]|nr:Rieske (2Fe-2S) protein [bacterium]
MTWHRVCDKAELKEQAGNEFAVAGRVIAVFVQGSNLWAVDGMCAHQGGPIAQGQVDGSCVTCPWHGWQYDIETGCNLLTGKQMLDTFTVEMRGAEVWVELPDAS